jgi:hypothetical protein
MQPSKALRREVSRVVGWRVLLRRQCLLPDGKLGQELGRVQRVSFRASEAVRLAEALAEVLALSATKGPME